MASMLFKLALAAFCFRGCATQIDDATVMIQSSAKKENAMLLTKFAGLGDLLQVGGSERLAAAQKMESSMELAVKKMINGTGIALPTEIFESLKSSVEQMAEEIFGEKDSFQTQITNANGDVALCNTHMKTTENSTVAAAKATADADRITHRTCREAESTAYDEKTLSCNANTDLTLVVANAAPDCNCALGPQGTPDVLTCLAANRVWVESNEVNLQAHLSDCNTKTDTWNNKANECDTDQSQFEGSVCSYDLKLENMCSALDTCYNDAFASRTGAEDMVRVEEKHLKAIFASAKKIVCFLSVLKKADTEKITMTDFDNCKNMDVLTDSVYLNNSVPDLTITYPAADSKESCQTLTSTPGEAPWEAAEYADFTKAWLRAIPVCPHKITPTTTAQ
jgi:hypothetical protein